MGQEKVTLISFQLRNFGIFFESSELSLASRKLKGRTFSVGGEDVLRYALVFGENASGKSTLVRALLALQTCVRASVEKRGIVRNMLPYNRLHVEGATTPVELAIAFGVGDVVYQYGFAYDHARGAFVHEYLHEDTDQGSPHVHFEQRNDELTLAPVLESKRDIFEHKKRPDALFLTTASNFAPTKDDLLDRVYRHICDDILILLTGRDHLFPDMAERVVNEDAFKLQMLHHLHVADFSITDLSGEDVPIKDIPPQIVEFIARGGGGVPESMKTLTATHRQYVGGEEVGDVRFRIGDESEGTRQFLNILAKYVDALEMGRAVVLDEFDTNLHPRLTKYILQLFQDSNPNNAQLIATTHDATLLDIDGLTKYHVYFTQKARAGSAELYSLADFSDLRNDKHFADDYLAGVFGAVPNVRLSDVEHADYHG